MIDVSVIIPIHNTEAYLSECLSSVEKLAKEINLEVILVDDGSTDDSFKIADRFIKKNGLFKLYHLDKKTNY